MIPTADREPQPTSEPMGDLPTNIVLIGFMGTGKSTIGRHLAEGLNWRFVDTDTVVERIAGCDIPTLFAKSGEAAFRDLESRAVAGVSAGVGQVIATGGGAILRAENVAALQSAGAVVWLTARPEVIVARTERRGPARPLLTGDEEPLTRVLRMLGERGPLYQQAADHIIDSSERLPRLLARDIERALRGWKRSRKAAPRL